MASKGATPSNNQLDVLNQIQATLQTIQQDYRQLSAAVEIIDGRVNIMAGIKQIENAADQHHITNDGESLSTDTAKQDASQSITPISSSVRMRAADDPQDAMSGRKPSLAARSSSASSRIILTTYPGQSGVDPIIMNWGHQNPKERGPVVVSRSQSTVRRRNGKLSSHAIGLPFSYLGTII